MTVDDQLHDTDSARGQGPVQPKERRAYVRPELVRYGALQEVTRAYVQTRSCRGQICENG